MGSLLHVRPKPGGRRRGVDTGAGRSCGEGSEGGTSEPTPTQPQPDVATARGTWAEGGAVGQHFLSPDEKHRKGKRETSNDGYFRSRGRGRNFSEGTFFL